MATKEIYEYDYQYRIGQIYVSFFFRNFYRKIVIKGEENLPKNNPYILAPNHQNALMDALAFVCTIKGQPVFMARADIFGKNKTIDNILYYLNIMPIYRIRDGYESLGKNEKYFEKAVETLENQVPLCIFAEGRHNDKRQQLPLVKGMFRIAFRTQEKLEEKNLQIVPVGLDYSNYPKFGEELIINIGKPIDVEPFYEKYMNDPVAGTNDIRNVLSEKMSEQMLNIHSTNHYESFYNLCFTLTPFVRQRNNYSNSVWNNFLCRKEIANHLDYLEQTDADSIEKIVILSNKYQAILNRNHINEKVLESNSSPIILFGKLLLAILFFPLFALGTALNFIPFSGAYLLSGKFKDSQFKSSGKFVGQLVLFPICYLILIIVGIFVLPNAWLTLLTPFIGYFTGKFAWKYLQQSRLFLKQLTFLFRPASTKKEIEELKNQIIGIYKS